MKKRNKKMIIKVIVGILSCLMVLSICLFFVFEFLSDNNTKKVLKPGGNTQEIIDRLNNLQHKEVHINFNPQVTFDVGTWGHAGKIKFPNLAENKLIMQCKLVIDGIEVANSGAIQPGRQITELKLETDKKGKFKNGIPKGEYNGRLTVEFYTISDDPQYLNSSHYEVKVIVKS